MVGLTSGENEGRSIINLNGWFKAILMWGLRKRPFQQVVRLKYYRQLISVQKTVWQVGYDTSDDY